ncbi:hypothetical protein BH11ARM2_BH11ARM2_37990 [soil metagenome]
MGRTSGSALLRGLPRADRLPFIEGIRGLLALYVALGHAASMADPSALAGRVSRAPDWLQSFLAPLGHGQVAVAAFIVVSGYCLQLSLYLGTQNGRVQGIQRYARRRALRILPPYYAALTISLLVAFTVTPHLLGYPFDIYRPVTLENVAAHVFLVHNLSLAWMYKINGVLWSIAIEAQLYLVFPFLAGRLLRWGRPLFLIAVTILAAVLFLTLPGAPKLYPWYLALFGLGMAGAAFAYRPNPHAGILPWGGAIITLGGMALFGTGLWGGWPLWALDGAGGLATTGLLYWLTVTDDFPLARFLGKPWLVVLGSFSYSLYLVHHPVMQVLWLVRPTHGSVADFFYLLATMPLTLAVAYGFSLLFERPFLPPKISTVPTSGERVLIALPLRTVGGLASSA